jgi:hypothetical protein
LIPRLEQNYAMRYRRRDKEAGLLGTLDQVFWAEDSQKSGSRDWVAAEARFGKPLVVIIDQVEEVYTPPRTGQPNELSDFLSALESIFADRTARPRGKLLLSFRKEWLSEIEQELKARCLPRAKIFLDRLDRQGIIEAVTGVARSERLSRHYGLTVESGVAELIADDLLDDRGSPIAPTLQILLTKMWDEAIRQNRSRPNFDRNLYDTLRSRGILLQDFLDQQMATLRTTQAEAVDSGLALDLLAFHTTSLGTAEQRTAAEVADEYRHRQDVLPQLTQSCKDLYLLADQAWDQAEEAGANATRLAHDTLAPLIRMQLDKSVKPGQKACRVLENRSVEWRDGQKGTPLDERDLATVEQGTAGMRAWKPEEERLVEASRLAKRARKHKRRSIIGLIICLVIWVVSSIAQRVITRQMERYNEIMKGAMKTLEGVDPVLETRRLNLATKRMREGLIPVAYLQIQSESQRAKAKEIQKKLLDEDIIVSEIVNVGPRQLKSTELRFYREEDRPQANEIVQALKQVGGDNVRLTYIAPSERSTKVRAKPFELCFAADAFDGDENRPVQRRSTTLKGRSNR